MSELLTKRGNHRVRKINDLEFQIEKDVSKGMKVPVKIYANDDLISKMVIDRTIDQAVNVSTLPGVTKHVVVLPDGHEGYGFPVGGVVTTTLKKALSVQVESDMILIVVSDCLERVEMKRI